jgi:uncharacterized protein (TIGR02594 family)
MTLVPKHLEIMRQITGTHEAPGDADNPVILQWPAAIAQRFPAMGLYCALYKHDETPWCGLTVAYCMALAGIEPPYHSSVDTQCFLWARSWEAFGRGVSTPEPGDVIVFAGHVSLYERTEGANYVCRGGNQSDQVKESSYAASSVIAIRRAVMATLASSPADRMTDITATVFGGAGDRQTSAYDGHVIGDTELACSLPFRFPAGARPLVRVFGNGTSLVLPIVDVGPWNTDDPYWTLGTRPQAESGTDHSGRHTNKAGIDLTPAAARLLGVDGKGEVDWQFDTPIAGEVLPSKLPAPALPRVVTINLDALEALLALVVMLIKKEHEMNDTTQTPAPPAPATPDVLGGLNVLVPLLLKLIEARSPAPTINLPAVIPPAPTPISIEPAPAPAPASKFGVGTGILGTILALIAHQQGVIADPVGPASSIMGLLSFALPIAATVFGGVSGFGPVLRVLAAVITAKK